ncbi:malate synthase A [Paraliomyxa miuraensis]|uniref:malate synthase A n=1 Tax=Paraliomyxa miuraensis TaxID=376150 RepID=UPI0022531D9A|nr:malate synthase A [Paraliomyxa miuraensis]MCX4242224.1 malate synthase A [Paraliomyxa miuraensis]
MVEDLEVLGPTEGYETILTPHALRFVASLVAEHAPRIDALLLRRRELRARYDAGQRPDFLAETADIRAGDWTVAPIPADLLDRRVEITGPVDPKMIINALRSGANVFMADCEDSCAPTWANEIGGQLALYHAVRRALTFDDPITGKHYALDDGDGAERRLATLMVRPRGLHLPEHHVTFEGRPIPGCLLDFGLYFFHNAAELLARGSGPYFYLPKLESHLEARLWNDVFIRAQDRLGIPRGSIRATVLIETLPAAFEMDEILYELREHSAGLNCGRWDYIFSFIKTFRAHPAFVLPDRAQVGMTQPFMRAYTARVIETCHRRRIHAMGGMAAQIPIKDDPQANRAAMEKVRADKLREVQAGHDGTWVAHPGLIGIAREAFDAHLPGPNQIDVPRDHVRADAAALVAVPEGTRTEEGLRQNVRVGIQYLEAWLSGNGCVPLYSLMEDAATAEISRAQVWQWLAHGAALTDEHGVARVLTRERLHAVIDEELAAIRQRVGADRFDSGRFGPARELFERLSTDDELEDFLTLAAYEQITTVRAPGATNHE